MPKAEPQHYDLLSVFNQFGDIERALLRQGNVYNGSIKSDFDELPVTAKPSAETSSRVVETCTVGMILYIIMLGVTILIRWIYERAINKLLKA